MTKTPDKDAGELFGRKMHVSCAKLDNSKSDSLNQIFIFVS